MAEELGIHEEKYNGNLREIAHYKIVCACAHACKGACIHSVRAEARGQPWLSVLAFCVQSETEFKSLALILRKDFYTLILLTTYP